MKINRNLVKTASSILSETAVSNCQEKKTLRTSRSWTIRLGSTECSWHKNSPELIKIRHRMSVILISIVYSPKTISGIEVYSRNIRMNRIVLYRMLVIIVDLVSLAGLLVGLKRWSVTRRKQILYQRLARLSVNGGTGIYDKILETSSQGLT